MTICNDININSGVDLWVITELRDMPSVTPNTKIMIKLLNCLKVYELGQHFTVQLLNKNGRKLALCTESTFKPKTQ
jgi:hypothetical protein